MSEKLEFKTGNGWIHVLESRLLCSEQKKMNKTKTNTTKRKFETTKTTIKKEIKKKRKHVDTRLVMRTVNNYDNILQETTCSFQTPAEIEHSIHTIYRKRKWGKLGDCTLSKAETQRAIQHQCSLLYGEILPCGVQRLCQLDLLHIERASRVVDMGSGFGKLAVQLFFTYTHLQSVWGVEFSVSRFAVCHETLRGLCHCNPRRLQFYEDSTMSFSVIDLQGRHPRTLRFFCSDMLSRKFQKRLLREEHPFDCIICETEIPSARYATCLRFLRLLADRPNTSLMTYHDLDALNESLPEDSQHTVLFQQLKKCYPDDPKKRTIKTSWSQNAPGHIFHVWN